MRRHPETDGLVQMHLVMIRASFCGRLSACREQRSRRLPSSRRRTGAPIPCVAQHEHAVVETVVPEIVEPRVPILFGIKRLSPEAAEVRVEVA